MSQNFSRAWTKIKLIKNITSKKNQSENITNEKCTIF